ncbi:Amt family ammonium transporter [Methylohalomonas lacus]|uniref:Ammonium transporter n=2 Tax=Methylohalomonas lacus TaxID=398773 RepID=A0AAE3HII1_9GAMM|nr:Amt family ammonium transporter [Methylohalomonas lacus]
MRSRSLNYRHCLVCLMVLLWPIGAWGQTETDSLSQLAGDSVWIVTAAALVFFMQAGFALLESGMSRSKNTVNVIMKNYMDVCLGSLMFWLIGYGLMFGTNPTGWFGMDHFALNRAEPGDFGFLFFQTMFAATAVTIASGAMAERTRYQGYLYGAIIICAFVYPVYGSWVWGGFYGGSGWLADLGFIDFAGSTVVHSVGGWIALAGIIVLGPRLGRFSEDGEPRYIPGHNLGSVALGGFILWLGWFGFNAGSTVSADVSIGLIALNTHLAAAAGATGAVLALALLRLKPLMTMTVNGSIGGLVGITAGCASMAPSYAIVTGLIAGVIVVLGTLLLERIQLDDVVGAVPVHAFAGVWGTLAAGIFYSDNPFNPEQIIVQLIGIAAGFVWTFPVALIVYAVINRFVGLRIDTVGEQRGLDYSEHYEIGYPEFQQDTLHQGKN